MTHPFDQHYFNGGGKVGGYAHDGYSDFACHQITFDKVMELKPKSVIEIGCARGYVLKRLEDAGVTVRGLEISEHCRLTRVVEDVVTWDITKAPWPVKDKEFNLCLSVAALEHVAEDKLPVVFAEMERTCKRGLHGIDLHDDDHFDKTHVSIHELPWWEKRLPLGQRGVDKESLEHGELRFPKSEGVKLNLGSFTTMFRGWRNFDHLPLGEWAAQRKLSFIQWDLRRGVPFDDGVVDLVYCCHMLEHLTYEEGAALLGECRRVLKPGGVARFLVPDAGKLISGYRLNELEFFDELSSTALARPTAAGKLWELLLGGGHQSIYDQSTLEQAFAKAGFSSVEKMGFRNSRSEMMRRETVNLYPDLSLIVEATR